MLPCPAAARVRLVRQHPPFPRLLCSFSRPRFSFPSGDDRASCAARCSSSDGRFAGDEHPTGLLCTPMSNPGSDPDDKKIDPEVQRFQLELEFVQCLANPTYIHYLAQNRYFEDEAFIGYLKYLKYWQRPEYIKYIIYPHCLFFLELLQNANFRNAMAHPANKELAHRQQYFFWKNYRNNRLKHILPRPPPEPAPAPAPSQGTAAVPLPPSVPTPAAPPVPALSSSMPPVAAGGASAMSPMQFVGTPGTNMPKTDMRNAMGNRKRKMG